MARSIARRVTAAKVLYHLTNKAKFKLDPKKIPDDNTLAIDERTSPGLFVATNIEPWVNGKGYWRPFVVELSVPDDAVKSGRWGGELFLHAERFDDAKILRVIPLDAWCREHFQDWGWTEAGLGTRFDTGEPLEIGPWGNILTKFPQGYRFQGDVRSMPSGWTAAYAKRVRSYAKRTHG